jgi:hypothetical protein
LLVCPGSPGLVSGKPGEDGEYDAQREWTYDFLGGVDGGGKGGIVGGALDRAPRIRRTHSTQRTTAEGDEPWDDR